VNCTIVNQSVAFVDLMLIFGLLNYFWCECLVGLLDKKINIILK